MTAPAPRVSLIWAMAQNRVIGIDNRLPWHLPADLKRFRALTTGHHIIMGRNTFESFPKPLPNRIHVVVTHDRNYRLGDGCIVVHSVEDALLASKQETEVFVIGGASLYAQTLVHAQRLYMTEIHADVAGDAFFPEFAVGDWQQVEREDFAADANHRYAFSFVTLARR